MGNPVSKEAAPALSADWQGVELMVTPDLKVPSERLPTTALIERGQHLASQEAKQGLVGDGGLFNFEPGAVVLRDGHRHGFIAAATAAFAEHYPLAVRPQHFWLMILQAVAVHVEKHAEELRSLWVAHDGKKELTVICNEFVLGRKNDWASVVDGKPDCFSVQINDNIVGGLVGELVPTFSNTSVAENISLKATVMDVTKSFFSYKCSTKCGFPSVSMEGSPGDWQLLRISAEALIKHRCRQDFADLWCEALLPLLDRLLWEYGKAGHQPDERFWNSMCKRGGTTGSGARTWFNGWINVFFPYIDGKPNRYMEPYSEDIGYAREGRKEAFYGMWEEPSGVQGPDCEDFPGGLTGAPVTWSYLGSERKLKFKAGFVGAAQDQAAGVIRPLVGWFIAYAGSDDEDKGEGG